MTLEPGNPALARLLTEIAARLSAAQQVPVCAPHFVEGCRDGLGGEAQTPPHRRSPAWHDGFALGRRFLEEL